MVILKYLFQIPLIAQKYKKIGLYNLKRKKKKLSLPKRI